MTRRVHQSAVTRLPRRLPFRRRPEGPASGYLERHLATLAIVVASLLMPSANQAGAAGPSADLVRASLVADAQSVAPGGTFTLGVRLVMKPHWHTYWVNPGEAGDATKVKLAGPAGFEFGAIQWPLPTKIDAPGGVTYGYEDEVLLLIPVTVPRGVSVGADAAITADVKWLVCKEACIKGGAKLSITLPVAATPAPANHELFETWRQRLPAAADSPAASQALEAVEQPAGPGGGSPAPALAVRWKQAPRKVEWFPISTRAVAIDDVVVRHEARATRIEFKPTVYQPDAVPNGRVEGVLVFEDADGRRQGVSAPVTVPVPTSPPK